VGERTWQEWLPLPALTADAPQITAYLAGRGYLDTDGGMLEGPRLLLLGGWSWRVTWTDWKRRRCFVEPAEGGGTTQPAIHSSPMMSSHHLRSGSLRAGW
jgi:hypothetical protein